MKRLFFSFVIFFINGPFLQAQVGCNKIKFNGQAPAIWAIDGQINDWETILGIGTGNPSFPFNPPSSTFNYFTELTDFDTPDPQRDLRSFAFTHDDYNVYFYFRRIQNSNAQSTFFYFLDINVDGLMSFGEPVLYANFNSHNISPIALGSYIPNMLIDYDAAGEGNYMAHLSTLQTCNVDSYSMKGEVSEIFNSASIPVSNLLQGYEAFSAAVTEDGFGIEFAVPWRYLKNWATNSSPLSPVQNKDLFAYRASIQNGAGKYQPHKVADNAGGNDCGTVFPIFDLAISGFPDFNLQNSSIETLLPGSFRIKLNYLNFRNITEVFDLGDITLKNIQASEGSAANVSGFTIIAYLDKNCNQFIDTDDPAIRYFYGPFQSRPDSVLYFGEPFFYSVGALQSVCLIIDISFPEDNSVKSCEIEFNPRASIKVISKCACDHCAPLDGGKPINPIGFDLGLEPEVTRSKQYQISSETLNDFGNKIRIYPNPSGGNTNVLLPLELKDAVITLSDYSGKIIRKLITSGQRLVRLENLKSGFYILHVRSKDARIQSTKKLIVQ